MSSDKLSYEEAKARYICCPMCDRKICNRRADDCDVALYLKKENCGADIHKPIREELGIDNEKDK